MFFVLFPNRQQVHGDIKRDSIEESNYNRSEAGSGNYIGWKESFSIKAVDVGTVGGTVGDIKLLSRVLLCERNLTSGGHPLLA